MSGQDALTRSDDIDVAGLFSQLWKRKTLVLAITVLTFFGLLLGLSMIDPRYQSSARVLIENRESVFTRATEDATNRPSDSRFDAQAIGSQVEVIASDELALKVIRDLDLTKREEFVKTSLIKDVLYSLGIGSGSAGGDIEERALRKFREKLDVYAVEQSRVIAIEFSSTDRELSQQVPNALAEAFIALQRNAEKDNTSDATEWLGPEIEKMRGRVRAAEAKVAEYRANSDILVGNNDALLATQQLSEISTELSRVKTERSSAQAKVASIQNALKNGSSIDVVPEVISSPLIQRLRETQVSLKAQISELSTTLLPNHPRLKSLNSQVKDFDNQIRAEARNILASLKNNVDLTRKTEADLVEEVNRLKAEAARVGEAGVELRALEREAAAERELLETYLRRYREAASRQNDGFAPVNARIISRATLPVEPYFPKVFPFAIAGAIAMFILSAVAILAVALLTGAGRMVAQAKAENEVPQAVLVDTPSTSKNGPMVRSMRRTNVSQRASEIATKRHAEHIEIRKKARQKANPGVKEGFWDLANVMNIGRAPSMDTPVTDDMSAAVSGILPVRLAVEILSEMSDARIAITCPGGDDGSLSSMLLARELSDKNKSVVLVDMSAGGANASEMIGTAEVPGVLNLLSGMTRFENIVYQDRLSAVHVVPAGILHPGVDVPDMYSLADFTDILSDTYEFVVLDCGDADPRMIGALADDEQVIVVSRPGADPQRCNALESELHRLGYADVIQIDPDAQDRRQMASAA